MKYTNQDCIGLISQLWHKKLCVMLCTVLMLSVSIPVAAQEVGESYSDSIAEENIIIECLKKVDYNSSADRAVLPETNSWNSGSSAASL